jgi:NAD(P)-dependent dehydrogenase (short-subunit alcohol dehydrogenase family)
MSDWDELREDGPGTGAGPREGEDAGALGWPAGRGAAAGARFVGKTALITGGSSGIGLATATRLVAEGASVVVLARDQGRIGEAVLALREVAAVTGELLGIDPPRVEGASVDVMDEDGVRLAADAAAKLGDRLDICIASAGMDGAADDALEIPVEEFRKVLEVNVLGLFVAARAAAERMALDRLGGSIVLVASVNGLIAEPEFADYNTSKGGAVMLAKSLAKDWASRGIRVNAICPGYVDTPMTDSTIANIVRKTGKTADEARAALLATMPGGRMVQPEEVAAVALAQIADPSGDRNGEAVIIDGREA